MIEIKTQITSDSARILHAFQTKKNIPLFIISSLLLLFAGVLLLILKSYLSGVILIIFAVLFVPSLLLISKRIQSKFSKNNPLIQAITNTIRFEKAYVFVETVRADKAYTAKFNYLDFYRCYETAYHIFLYLKKKDVFIIPFADIVKGSSGELTKALKEELKARYRALNIKIS